MKNIQELQRVVSPAPKPQSLVWDGPTLWMGSRETRRIYQINPVTWTVDWETAAPGTPWGMTMVGKELRVICGETADDNRIIRRCVPGQGFDGQPVFPCPDDMGSQLGYDGQRLHLSQWYPKKVLRLGADGKVERTINVPHGICGQVFTGGFIYLVTTDAEETTDYWLTRVDLRPAVPKVDDLVRIPFAARAQCPALGSMPTSAQGIVSADLTSTAIWNTDPYNNGFQDHVWHSAEFEFSNADQQNYWNALMKRFGLPTTQ